MIKTKAPGDFERGEGRGEGEREKGVGWGRDHLKDTEPEGKKQNREVALMDAVSEIPET